MTTVTLNTPCYYVKDGKVHEAVLSDFTHFITTTRPYGVGYKYYVTTAPRIVEAVYDDDGEEIAPEYLEHAWALAKWATWGGPEIIISYYDSEEAAAAAAEEIYVHDILSNPEISLYLNRESAEAEEYF